jgi:hypothetical protein
MPFSRVCGEGSKRYAHQRCAPAVRRSRTTIKANLDFDRRFGRVRAIAQETCLFGPVVGIRCEKSFV